MMDADLDAHGEACDALLTVLSANDGGSALERETLASLKSGLMHLSGLARDSASALRRGEEECNAQREANEQAAARVNSLRLTKQSLEAQVSVGGNKRWLSLHRQTDRQTEDRQTAAG
jgi:hypothetical protein